jgi:hypothetical protein
MAFDGIGRFIDAVARGCTDLTTTLPRSDPAPTPPVPTAEELAAFAETLRGLEDKADAAAQACPVQGGELYARAASEAVKAGAIDDALRLVAKPEVQALVRAGNEDAVRAVKDAAVAVAPTDAAQASGLYVALLDSMDRTSSYSDPEAFIEYARLEFTQGELDKALAGLNRAKAAYLLIGDYERASWVALAQVAVHVHRRDLAPAANLLATDGKRAWFTAGNAATALNALVSAVKAGGDAKKARWTLFGIISDSELVKFGFASDQNPEGEKSTVAWVTEGLQ